MIGPECFFTFLFYLPLRFLNPHFDCNLYSKHSSQVAASCCYLAIKKNECELAPYDSQQQLAAAAIAARAARAARFKIYSTRDKQSPPGMSVSLPFFFYVRMCCCPLSRATLFFIPLPLSLSFSFLVVLNTFLTSRGVQLS